MSYASDAKGVRKDLKKSGAKCTLKKPIGAPVYSPELDALVENFDDYPGFCLPTGYSASMVDGTAIQAGDVKLLCSLDVEPTIGKDKIVVGLDTYRVMNCAKLAPDGKTVIMYTIQGRK